MKRPESIRPPKRSTAQIVIEERKNSKQELIKKMKLANKIKGRLSEEKTFDDYPAKAKQNAQQALDWKDEYGDEVTAMTKTGWARANQLAKGEPLSADTVKRMAAFNRHRKNAKVSKENKSTPHRDNGLVAWLGWGGDAGIDWAIKKAKELK